MGDGEALRRLGQRVSSVLKQQGREACTDSVVMLACEGWASRQAAASEADSLRAARHKTAGGELTAHESFTPSGAPSTGSPCCSAMHLSRPGPRRTAGGGQGRWASPAAFHTRVLPWCKRMCAWRRSACSRAPRSSLVRSGACSSKRRLLLFSESGCGLAQSRMLREGIERWQKRIALFSSFVCTAAPGQTRVRF